jgi:WD40 repeat protein
MALAFISHSNQDQELARDLENRLASIGFASVFLDFDKDKGIDVGTSWERRLYQELEHCEAVLIVLTPAWLESKWCFAEFTQARALGKAIFPVIMSPVGERFFAGDIQYVDITKEGEGGFEKLSRSLTEIALNARGEFEWDHKRPPYPGLLAFQEEDAAVFFGRDDDIRRIIEKMNVRRSQGGAQLLTLLGASGTGKSSLLRAGLIPRQRRDPANWIIVPTIRPGRHPLDELARALGSAFVDERDWRTLRDQLAGEGATKALRTVAQDLQTKARAHHATVLLAFDQAEELFSMASAEDARAFMEVLSLVFAGDLPFLGLLVMRSDQLDRLQRAAGLTCRFEELSLRPMPFERMGEIIRGPAKVANLEIDEQLVSAAMRDSATSDALPLLAFTLRELYEHHGASGKLTLADYENLGGVGLNPLENAVRRAADETLAAAKPTDEEIDALRQAFVAGMVRINEVGEYSRRSQFWTELPAKSVRLIEALIGARLLVARGTESQQQIEVAHEALLRKWPKLTGWLDLERDLILGKRQIEVALADWKAAPVPLKGEALLHGLLLTRAREWLAMHRYALTAEEQAFIAASARSADARVRRQVLLRRMVTWGSIASAVTFAGLSAVAVWQWNQSEKNRALSNHNLGLALLTQAEVLMKQEKPARAFITASIATGMQQLKGQTDLTSFLGQGTDAYLRARTIANISGASAVFPRAVVDAKLPVYAVSITSRGDLVAFAGQDQKVKLLRTSDLTVFAQLEGHGHRINSVRLALDGALVATASTDRTIGLWDTKKNQATALCGHAAPVDDVDFHPGGEWLASAGRDGLVQVWNTRSHAKATAFQDVEGWAQAVRFSPDGELLSYADQAGNVVVRKTADWAVVTRIKGLEKDVISLAISGDGKKLVSGTYAGAVRVRSLPEGANLGSLSGHNDKLWRVSFTPDNLIATASWDGTVRLWDSETFQHAATIDAHDHWVNDVAFAATGAMVTASEDGRVRLWDVAGTTPMFRTNTDHDQDVPRAAFSKDGRIFASGSLSGKVRVYRFDERGRLQRLCDQVQHPSWVLGLALTSDGSLLASIGTAAGAKDNFIALTDTKRCETIRRINLGEVHLTNLRIDPADKYLAGTTQDGAVRLFDIASGVETRVFRGHSGAVTGVSFDATGELLASAGRDRQIIVWRVADGGVVRQLRGHEAPIWFMQFSADGQLIASGGGERAIRIWDWKSGQQLPHKVVTHTTVAGLLFLADGTHLVVGDDDRSISVWNTSTWRRTATLSALVGVRGPLAAHPSLPLIAFDGENGAVRFWDLARGGSQAKVRQRPTLEGTRVRFTDDRSGDPVQGAAPVATATISACK